MVSGHLREKRGIYQIILTYKDFNGKKKEKSMSTGLPIKNNKRKAEEMLMEARRNFIVPEQATTETLLSTFLDEWLVSVKHNIELSTYGSYQGYIDKANVYFDKQNKTLSGLEPKDIQDFYTYLLNEKSLSANTVIHYHAVLRKALQYAVRMDILTQNPMDRVERPKIPKFIGSFYNTQEVNSLLEAVRDKQIEFAVVVGVFYGLRRSEIVGLKWNAIDFAQNTISIQHTVIQTVVDGEYMLIQKDRAKNKSSIRTLPLVAEFRELLLNLQKKQEEYKRLCGNCYNYDYEEYIFVDEMGNLIKPNFITQNFKIILRNNNLRDIRFHDLRHTCASILINKGLSLKEIQEWLGHSNFATTANIYAHLEKNSKDKVAKTMLNSGINFSNKPSKKA